MSDAVEELLALLAHGAVCHRTSNVTWVNGFTPRKPADLGRSLEGQLLRELYRCTSRVRGRVPFDIAKLSARPGQSLGDWLDEGLKTFEAWLGLPLHGQNETTNAVGELHRPERRRSLASEGE